MAKKAIDTAAIARHSELVNALKVMVLTPHIARYLQQHDPKALVQAAEALGMTPSDVGVVVRPSSTTADFVVTQHGSVFTFVIQNDRALAHAREQMGLDGWQWMGENGFAVNHQLAPELCYRLREDGFVVVVR